MSKDSSKQKIVLDMKIGIVKKLYNDGKITAKQYQFLLLKYGYND